MTGEKVSFNEKDCFVMLRLQFLQGSGTMNVCKMVVGRSRLFQHENYIQIQKIQKSVKTSLRIFNTPIYCFTNP